MPSTEYCWDSCPTNWRSVQLDISNKSSECYKQGMYCSVCHLCKLSIAYRHTSPSNQTLCNRCRTTRTSWWWTRGWWRRAKSSRWRYCSTTVLSSPWVINRNCKFSPWCIWDKKRPRRDEKSQNGKSRPEKLPTSEKFTFLTKILQSHYGCRLMRCLCDQRIQQFKIYK